MDQVAQSGILAALPAAACYAFFQCRGTAREARTALAAVQPGDDVFCLGQALCQSLGVAGGAPFKYPAFANKQRSLPHTPEDLLVWVRADDPGAAALKLRRWQAQLAPAFVLSRFVDAFVHDKGRDLTGYEDGTENPEGENAAIAALVADGPLKGASFLALQQWQHDMLTIDSRSREQMNHIVGRDQTTNRELADAPESAHVKRTEQESFEPHQFVLRRSMPWIHSGNMGLMFAAFGCSFAAFEAQMWQMLGRDDGIEDALFTVSRPLTGAYFYCPPRAGLFLNLDV